MINIIAQARNAITAYNEALQATSSNIANMNVPGYKKLSVDFQTVFENLISQGTQARGDVGGTNPRQLGQGVTIAGTSIDTSTGEFSSGSSLDLGISGQGFFVVSADAGLSYLYTRNGNFQIDASGNLTSNGNQVYGLDSSGNVVPISNLISGNRTDYKWLADGTLQYSADGGATFVNTGYRIALTYFPNASGLAQAAGTSFKETISSGSPATPQIAGGAAGSLKTGQIEQSNVNYLEQSIISLELQQAMSANLSVVKLASDTISSVIQKLG